MRRRLGSFMACLTVLTLSGCIGADPAGPAEPRSGTSTHIVAALQQTDFVAADAPVCLPEPLPAWHEVPRVDGGLVPRGTELLEIAAVVTGIWTGFQVGYRIDDAPFVWSERSDQGSTSVILPLQPHQHEEDGLRWTFAWRTRLVGQDCMEGAYSGSLSIVVAAHGRSPA